MSTINPEHSPRSYRVPVEGGSLHLLSYGDEDKAPVLALHGWALDHRLFAPQVPALVAHYRLLALDRRGFGASQAPPDLRREVQDIEQVLDALSIDKVHLLGVSQGGRIALRYAARSPQRVRSLILLGAAVDGVAVQEPAEERLPIEEFAELAREGRMEEVHARWLLHPMMQQRPQDPALDALLERMVHDYGGRDLSSFSPGEYAWPDDVLARMREFDAPVLLLTGERETAARKEQARALLGQLAHGRELQIPDAGHLANLIAPQLFNDYLLDFLASTGAADADSARATD